MRIRELFESFDSTYKVKQTSPTTFTFTTDMGNPFTIEFVTYKSPLFIQNKEREIGVSLPEWNEVTEVDFMIGDGDDKTYKFVGGNKKISSLGDNTSKIFATVMNTTFYYVNQKNVNVLYFSGELTLGRLYKRLVRMFVPKTFVVNEFDGQGKTHFFVERR